MAEKSRKAQLEGLVSSNAMEKSIVVTVERLETHPVFKKVVRRKRKFMAHDENDECKVGDRVLIKECRPLSKNKCWRVVRIIERQA